MKKEHLYTIISSTIPFIFFMIIVSLVAYHEINKTLSLTIQSAHLFVSNLF